MDKTVKSIFITVITFFIPIIGMSIYMSLTNADYMTQDDIDNAAKNTIYKINYDGHTYIKFSTHSVLHDPDCKCHNKNIEEDNTPNDISY